ncbi:L-threonine 3-dehydrogenase [Acidobacteriia bacterium AH_259_A11_L15]|nr:L-threonine 3-dehydrogenase [Acidobacteriia bacterium AH_259_A11_L15]
MPTREMNALVKTRPEPGASLDRRPRPPVGPNDVLVAVQAASICGTDLHIYSWDPVMRERIHPPMIFGHEFCGTVEEVGSEVEAIQPGQFVSAEMHVACGHCLQCRLGQQHVCQKLEIIGIDRDGCFAQYVKIPASNILPIDPSIPRDYAAVLDPLGNAVHTVLAGEIAGQRVAVVGCGPIGLMAIQVAKACGASAVYGIEVKPERLKLAERVGADGVFNPRESDVVAAVREATRGDGADVVLEMSGNPQGVQQAFKMLRAGGRLSLLGLPPEPVTLDLVPDIIFKGATVQGIYGRRMYDTWYRMLSLLKAGALDLDPLISERLPLERYHQAFDLLRKGQASKILLYPNGIPR